MSLPCRSRSTSITRTPARASSSAVDAPATRPPTTTTSCRVMQPPVDSPRRDSPTSSGRTDGRPQTVASCRAPSMKPESRRCWKGCPTTYRPGTRGDARLLTDRAVRSQDREMQPRVIRAIPSRDEHSSDVLSGQVKSRDGVRHLTGRGRVGSTSPARPASSTYRSTASRKRCILRSASATVSSRSLLNEATVPTTSFSLPARRTPRACSTPRSRSRPRRHGSGLPDQLQRVLPTSRAEITHVIDGAGQPTGGSQPPEPVHPPVAARHPGVPADGQEYLAAGARPVRRRSVPRTRRRPPRARRRARAAGLR